MVRSIDAAEVARHNQESDVWIIVDGEVYDMTELAPKHPGGAQIIYQWAGSDASKPYHEIHSPSLIRKSLDAKCHLGRLHVSSVTSQAENGQDSTTTEQRPAMPSRPELDAIISLDDFELAAEKSLSKKAMAYISSGSNDNISRENNNNFLRNIWLRPAVMRDVSKINTRATLFGCPLDLPVYISPTGGARIGGAEGELTLARGAAAGGIIHCFATTSSYPYSEVLEHTARWAFFQLYVNKDRAASEAVIREVVASSKIKALFVTADLPVVSKREADERVRSTEPFLVAGAKASVQTKDNKGAGLARQTGAFIDPSLSWDDIKWLRSLTSMPILIKGIQRAEDAVLAYEMGCDGIVLGNHGGRAADGAPPAIMILLELRKHCPHVLHGMEVLVDGGFRRGSDVVKAVCLGASAVGLGRPFLYSLSYGQPGVERAIEILKDEVNTAMRLCGMTDLMRDAHPRYLNIKDLDRLIPDGESRHNSLLSRILRVRSRL